MIPPITIIVASNAPRRRAREGSLAAVEFNSPVDRIHALLARRCCSRGAQSPRIGRTRRLSGAATAREECLQSRQIVNLDQAHTYPAVLSRNDRSISSWNEAGRNRGFEGISRREAIGADLRGLGRILLPVIICHEKCTVVVVQLERRIEQRISYTGLGQRRTKRADEDFRRPNVIPNDETSYKDVGASLDGSASADISQTRGTGPFDLRY